MSEAEQECRKSDQKTAKAGLPLPGKSGNANGALIGTQLAPTVLWRQQCLELSGH